MARGRGSWRGIERVGVPRSVAVITVTDGIAERLQALYALPERPAVVRNVTELEPPAGADRARCGRGSASATRRSCSTRARRRRTAAASS